MNETLLIWGIALIAASFLLLGLEIFIPSGGLIAVTSGLVAISGVICLFRYDTVWGLTGALAVLVIGPIVGAFFIKIWPDTPMGRRLVHGENADETIEKQRFDEAQERNDRLALIGLEGEALTTLRPVGTARIGTRRIEVLSETGWIEAGSKIRVMSVDGIEVRVRMI